MKKYLYLILCLLFAASTSGCIKTYTYQVERKDQELNRGNRGYFMGDTPEPKEERKLTRTMGAVDITLPATKDYKARKEAAKKKAPIVSEPEEAEEVKGRVLPFEAAEIEPEPEESAEKTAHTLKETVYEVREGDTLEKIAKKFLGSASKWPVIFEANKDIIRDPARIYPGQVIAIPALTTHEEREEIK